MSHNAVRCTLQRAEKQFSSRFWVEKETHLVNFCSRTSFFRFQKLARRPGLKMQQKQRKMWSWCWHTATNSTPMHAWRCLANHLERNPKICKRQLEFEKNHFFISLGLHMSADVSWRSKKTYTATRNRCCDWEVNSEIQLLMWNFTAMRIFELLGAKN